MILHATDGTMYKVHFKHCVEHKFTRCLLHKGDCQMTATDCLQRDRRGVITDVTLIHVIGEARCGPRDVFTKKMGRRISLGRALKQLVLSPIIRLQLMTDYVRQLHK